MTTLKDIENQILGKILVDSSTYFNNQHLLKNEELVFTGTNLEIFKLLQPYLLKGNVDLVTIAKSLTTLKNNVGEGLKYIADIKKNLVFKDATDSQISYVIETRTRELLADGLAKIQIDINGGKSVEEIQLNIKSIFESINKSDSGQFEPILRQFKELSQVIDRNISGDIPEGFKTGFFEIDKHTNGLQKTDLNLVVARTSVGKTSFSIQVANNIGVNLAKPVAFMSLEMSPIQLAARFASVNSGISSKTILYNKMTPYQIEQYNERIKDVSNSNIFLHDTKNNDVFYIINEIRQLHYKLGVDIFFIDYIQLLGIKGSKEGRTNDTGRIARELKNIAKELDVCINSLCQVSRNDKNPEKPPTVFDLRASGELEEAADNIIILHRPEAHLMARTPEEWKGIAEIEWAKGRNVGTNGWQFNFDGETTRFLSKEYKPMVSIKRNDLFE